MQQLTAHRGDPGDGKMKRVRGLLCTVLGLMLTPAVLADTPMEFRGVLGDFPCMVAPESQSQTVTFPEQNLNTFHNSCVPLYNGTCIT